MLLMDDEFRTNLLDAADVTEFLAHIDEAERKKFPEEYGEEKQTQDQPEEGYRVLAVTACPTGIAHTYMAAESLENKANDVPDSGRIYRHGACGQTGIDARNRRRSSGKKRYDNGCRGGRLGVFWFLWRTDRRFAAGLIMLGLKKILESFQKRWREQSRCFCIRFWESRQWEPLWYLWSIRRSERSMSG